MMETSKFSQADPQKLELNKRKHFSLRINLFFFCTFALFSVLIIRLSLLQFVEGKEFKAEETMVSKSVTPITPIRGSILDSKGYPIATSRSIQSLYFRAAANDVKHKDELIGLAKKLEDVFAKYGGKPSNRTLTAADIIKLMDVGFDLDKKETKGPSYLSFPRRIKADLSHQEIAYLSEHRDEMPRIEIFEDSTRVYDSNTIAAQLVGYMKRFSAARNPDSGLEYYKNKIGGGDGYIDTESVGFDGLEFMYQDDLRGKQGEKIYPINAKQTIVGKVTMTPPEKGHNLYLTINKDIQLTAEQAIMDQLDFIHDRAKAGEFAYAPAARSGYAVAMEVKTGKVVAMASMPDYNTNLWTGGMTTEEYNAIKPFTNNGTITTSYPDYPEKELSKHPSSIVYMGSTIKPLSVMVGLNEKLFTPFDTYNDTGSFMFGKDNSKISNSDGHAYGLLNPTTAIEHSSNTFMSAMVGIPLYNKYGGEKSKVLDVWASYLAKFGLGVKTESGLPGEYEGANEFKKNATNSSYMSAMVYASWGQNEKYTTLQLAQYAATLASRGKRMKPQFVDKITTYNGEVVRGFVPAVLNQESFPESYWDTIIKGMKSGAEGIEDLPYSVARKTGTSTQGVAGKTVDNAVFIAFAPVADPKLAVAVVVPEGRFGRYGAAPIAAKIFQAYDKEIGGLSQVSR